MDDIAHRLVGARKLFATRRRVVLFLLALAVAAGLVGVGRWTAPTASTAAPRIDSGGASCGTTTPVTMPSRACQRALERFYLRAPSTGGPSCGTVAPTIMSSRACQRVLEAFFRGAPRQVGS